MENFTEKILDPEANLMVMTLSFPSMTGDDYIYDSLIVPW